MVQHLRWSPEQLREHLIKRHGNEAAAKHPALKELDRTGPSALERALSNSQSQGAFAQASVRSLAPQQVTKVPVKRIAPMDPIDPMAQPGDMAPAVKRPGPPKRSSPKPKVPKSAPALSIPQNGECVESKPICITQRARSIESLKSARFEGTHQAGSHLELRFHGVVLLSVNTLYGLSHFQRVKYRKTWHEVVETAVASILGEAHQRQAFERYIIFAHRVSRRLADTDAKSGYLKYPIDGLRYAGVLVEDTEEHFRDFLCTQSIGEPALILRIEAVGEDYVPLAMRNPWAQAVHAEFAPAPKEKKLRKKAKSA
jgi:hypothetical protein